MFYNKTYFINTTLLLSLLTLAQGLLATPVSGFKITEVQESLVTKRILLGGSVVPISEVSFSAQISGDIVSFNGVAGDVYKKGDLIVSLEQKAIRAQRDAAQAEINGVTEALKNASVQYSKSIISPYADGNAMLGGMPGMFGMFTSPFRSMTGAGNPDFEKYAIRTNSYAEFAKANNRLKQARFKLTEIEEKLKDASVRAPFNGVLVKKMVSTGDSVQRGERLFTFANTDELQVEIDVPSRLLFSLKKGKKYRILLDVSNYIVQAKLVQIHPMADRKTHTVKVKFNLPKNSPTISGSYAELELFDAVKSKSSPVVPKSAVVWRSSIPSLFVVNKDNKTELRFVRLGDKVDRGNISVLSGLKKGERVVQNPGILMTSGMSI